MKYKAYLVEENNGEYIGSVRELDTPDLQEGRLLIKVKYSSLNYKDALAATGAKGVVRSYPFVPGIDVAGEIIKTRSSKFSLGDEVIATCRKASSDLKNLGLRIEENVDISSEDSINNLILLYQYS